MFNLHNQLVEKNGSYAKWHSEKEHKVIHRALLLLVAMAIIGLIPYDKDEQPIKLVYAQTTSIGPQASITCPAGSINILPGQDIPSIVDSNPSGTSFCVQVGTYYPTRPIYLKSNDKLIGQYGAIIDGQNVTQSYDPGSISIISGWNCASCNNVTVRNLIIRNPAKNIPKCVGAAGSNAANWVIDHNDISGCQNSALSFGGSYNAGGGSSGWQMTFNKIHDTPRYASFYLQNNALFSYNDVSNVSEHDGKWAIGGYIHITNNNFHDFGPNTAMVWLDTVSNFGGHNIVCDNVFTNPGVGFVSVDIEATTNTEVCRNTFNGGSGTSPQLWLTVSQDIYVHDNIFNYPTSPATAIFWDGQSKRYYTTCPSGLTNSIDPTCDIPLSNPPAYVSARNRVLNNTFYLGNPIQYQPFVGYQCSNVTQTQCLTSMDNNGNIFDGNRYCVANASGTYWYRAGSAINFSSWQAQGQDLNGSMSTNCSPPFTPTPTLTSAPTPTPTPTPSPTPTPVATCMITGVSWDKTSYTVGDTVNMTATVADSSACQNNTLSFYIYEEDPLNPDDFINGLSQVYLIAGNQMTISYQLSSQDYINGGNESGNESIYFIAQVQGQSVYSRSVQVNFYNSTPTPTPIPTTTTTLTPTPTPTLTSTITPFPTLTPTPLPTPGAQSNPGSLLEDFDASRVPKIFAGLACYMVRFGIIAAGLAMILSAIIFILSRGNPVALSNAKKTFLYALIGALIIYGVYTIILSISLYVVGSTNLPWVPLTCS